jgi:uncharacterized membrane protein SirB2
VSLKAFHVFFIVVSILFAAAFGWWAWNNGERRLAAVSLASAPLLTAYLVWFLKSKKGLAS